MRRPQPMPPGAAVELSRLLQSAPAPDAYQRGLCLWLRAALHLPATQVTAVLGWHVGSVYNLQSRYLRDGSSVLLGLGRGGRRHALLTEEPETQLLSAFASTAGQGGVVEASVLRRAYEEKVGEKVAKSTVYRLLARQGWRKLVPRPYHPDASPKEQEAFKKNCASECAPKPHGKPSAACGCAYGSKMKRALGAWWTRVALGCRPVYGRWSPGESSGSTATPMPPSRRTMVR
jgi:transposase